jgi:hypothetical protein
MLTCNVLRKIVELSSVEGLYLRTKDKPYVLFFSPISEILTLKRKRKKNEERDRGFFGIYYHCGNELNPISKFNFYA